MKKLLGIIAVIALLSSCGTAQYASCNGVDGGRASARR